MSSVTATITDVLDDFFKEVQTHESVSLDPLRKCFMVMPSTQQVRFLRSTFTANLTLAPDRQGVKGMIGSLTYDEPNQTLSYQNQKSDVNLTCKL